MEGVSNISRRRSNGVHVEDGGHRMEVADDAAVDDVAGEVVVHSNPAEYNGKQARQYSAATLRTTEYLRGRPRVYVATGRPRQRKIDPGQEEVEDVEGAEDPPLLSDPDGSYATPSMKPLFRLYSDASLRKADTFLLSASSVSSRSTRPRAEARAEDEEEEEEEVVEETVHEMDGQEVTGEELEQLIDESNAMGETESIETKQEIFEEFGDVIDEGEHQVVYEMGEIGWATYAERPIDFPDACDLLIGNTTIPPEKVCKTVPQGCKEICTFIVDMSSLHDRHDISHDGMGSWGKPSGRTRFYRLNRDNNKYEVVSDGRGQLPKGQTYDVKCQLKKYEHPTTAMVNNGRNRFIKKIITCVDRDSIPSQYAIVTYEWIGAPIDFAFVSNPEPRRTRGFAPMPPDGSRTWEAASFQSSSFSSFPETCTATIGGLPIYSFGAIQFHDVCNIILGATHVDPRKICDRVPQGFRECGTFVIDVESLSSELELRRDNNGQWGKPAGNSRYFKMENNGSTAKRVDRCGRLESGQRHTLQVLCKRYEHPLTNNRFVRKIYTGRIPVDSQFHHSSSLAVITYFWKGDPIPFEVVPQRKVRLHDASEYEMLKREGRLPRNVYEDELGEDEMMGMMGEGGGGGGSMYMEAESALVEDPITVPMMPPRKRKKSEGVSIAAERAPMQQAAAGHPTEEDIQFAKMALLNQQRFSSLLDRFESVAEKMERMAEMQMNMMWRASRQFAADETRDRPEVEGEVQYVEEEVYEMEGE